MDRRLYALFSGTLVYCLGGMLDVLSTGLVAVLTLGFGTSLTVTYFDDPGGESRDRAISTAFWILAATSGAALALARVPTELRRDAR